MGGAAAPFGAFVVFEDACGIVAVEAADSVGSDFRPSEYPSAKNTAQIATSPKNKTRSFPVPSVISVSSDEAITQLP
jgi:hypothetical protein